MSRYTTGEMARLCGVSVRTVQYYDNRGLLAPSELSEGGRRLYSEADAKKLRVICFLKSIGLQLGSIAEILEAENVEKVAGLLLEQQSELLQSEIAERQKQLQDLNLIRRELKNWEKPSLETLNDIAAMMENKKKMRKVYALILTLGLLLEAVEIAFLILWIRKGIWQPFVLFFLLEFPIGIWIVRYFYQRAAYICPECHTVFRPTFWQMFFAKHTPRTRKLTCTGCGYRGYCVETHADALKNEPKS